MGARGPQPGTVTKPPGSGRQPGTPNKATADVKAIAQQHGPEVIAGFVELFRNGESEQARIAAGKEILDRAYGKASQVIAGDPEAPVTFQEIARKIVHADNRDSRGV